MILGGVGEFLAAADGGGGVPVKEVAGDDAAAGGEGKLLFDEGVGGAGAGGAGAGLIHLSNHGHAQGAGKGIEGQDGLFLVMADDDGLFTGGENEARSRTCHRQPPED